MNFSILICPSSCYTWKYLSNQNAYPIFGNETYSGVCFYLKIKLKVKILFYLKNSLVCKSAYHDGRVAPWNGENSPVLIQNTSRQLSIYSSALRNGILSSKFIFSNIYLFYLLKININII